MHRFSRRLSHRISLALTAAVLAVAVVAPAHAGTHELTEVVAARSDEDKARDVFRHPEETLEFFGVTHTSHVVEAMPGAGWYTRILLPLVGEKGTYGAFNYHPDTYSTDTDERRARRAAWPKQFKERAAAWTEGEVEIKTWVLTEAPEDLYGTVDHVLFIRALHGLTRAGGTKRQDAIEETFKLLKSGGVAGVVQHRAPAGSSDDWADGEAGYLKEADIVAAFEAAGFELAGKSEVNANPKDQPTEDDSVWRLPPTLRADQSDADKAKHAAIGESDRMTLKFVKP